jgi:hypothetical protein
MWVMGVGGISLMSIDSLRRRAVADRGLALCHDQYLCRFQKLKRAYCWHTLLGFAVLRDGRVAIVALWTAGRSALTIDAMIMRQIRSEKVKNKIRLCVEGRNIKRI